ncbi:hypothetical protein SLS58_003164 [Diplodia intermedia]|uniref:F-box domain-containing protein n=1 Tax=Diplodia intermedia TaxID=856260 RepID=A0ABR3TXZ7_9PEZI
MLYIIDNHHKTAFKVPDSVEQKHEVAEYLVDLLTVRKLPDPKPNSDDVLNASRAKQLLRLPLELINHITSYIVQPWQTPYENDAIHGSYTNVYNPDRKMEEVDISGTADLACLGLTCRYFFAILHPNIRSSLERGAAAPWQGCYLSMRKHCPYPKPTQPNGSSNAVVEIFKRLDKDGERSRSMVRKTFSHEVLGRRGFECGRNEDGRYWRTVVVLVCLGNNRYIREEALDRLTYKCCLGDMLLAWPWFLLQVSQTTPFEIRILPEHELGDLDDITKNAIELYEEVCDTSILGVGKRADF